MNVKKLTTFLNCHSKEFMLSGIAQFVYMSQALIQNKLFAVYFNEAGFGRWSLLTSVFALVSMLPFTAVDQGLQSVASSYRKESRENDLFSKVVFSYLTLYIGYTIISFLFFLIHGRIEGVSIILFLLYTFTEIFQNTFLLLDNAYRNRGRVLVIRLVNLFVRISLYVVLGLSGVFTINNVLLVLIFSNVLCLIILKYYWIDIKIALFCKEYRAFYKTILAFSAPLLIWAVFGWLQNMIGRWYLGFLINEYDVAMYTMLTSISYYIPYAFQSIVSTYIMPIAYSRENGYNQKDLSTLLLLCLGVLGVYFIIIFFWGGDLVLLLADKKYISIVKYLPFTTISSIFYVLSMLSTIEIYRQAKTKKLLVPTILPGLSMSTVGFYLIKNWGLDGAIINYMIGQALYSVMVLPISFKAVNKH